MAVSDSTRRQLADALWDQMLVPPDLTDSNNGISGAYRRLAYNPLARRCFERVSTHRSPEPWLSAKCALQAMSGDGWRRSERRFEGIIGGSNTESEYQLALSDTLLDPVVLVAGYPRSGTTSLQAVARYSFSRHIPEIETSERRFSLWEEPKHSSATMEQLAAMGDGAVVILAAVRPFLDAAASLVVGRGGNQHVDVAFERARWLSWLDVYASSNVHALAFETLTSSTPAELVRRLERITGLGADCVPDGEATFKSLISSTGKGSVDDPRQSNLPVPDRAEALAEARAWVQKQLGDEETHNLDEAYISLPFASV